MRSLDLREPGLARRALGLAWRILSAGRAAPAVVTGAADDPPGRAGAHRHVGRLHSMNALNDSAGPRLRGAATGVTEVDAHTLAVGADTTMEALALDLRARGRTLPVWGTHLVQTLAGAVNTGTHGSSLTHRSLAADVTRVELVDAVGVAHVLDAGHPDFALVVPGLGCFGRVTRYHLRVRPRLCVERTVRHRSVAAWLHEYPRGAPEGARFASHEAFVLYEHDVAVELRRVEIDEDVADAPFDRMRASPLGDVIAEAVFFSLGRRRQRDMLTRLLPEGARRGDNIALQCMRMATSRADHRGHKDCELAVAIDRLEPALAALTAALQRHAGHVWPFVHVRAQRADAFPLSASHGRDVAWLELLAPTVCTADRWRRIKADVHAALAPFDYRSHWAKESPGDTAWTRRQVPALARFAAARARYDPHGWLQNPHLGELLAGLDGA